MILLTVDEIIQLHSRLVERTGGCDGLRDRGLLESAVFNVESCFGGVEAYPTVEEKAARLLFSLANNHAFVDGNKRIGVLAMLMTLSLNDVQLQYSQEELITLGLSVADGSYDYPAILKWIRTHKK